VFCATENKKRANCSSLVQNPLVEYFASFSPQSLNESSIIPRHFQA
jgi:hypothetical protein